MKLLVVLAFVAAASAGAAPQFQEDVQILKYDSVNDGQGNWYYAYEQSDGQKQEQKGELQNPGEKNELTAVKGSYTWVGPDGVTYLVTYKADDQGYQPTIEQGPGGGVPPGVVASLLG